MCIRCCRTGISLIRKKWCKSCYSKGLRDRTIRRLRRRARVIFSEDWATEFKLLYNNRVGLTTRASFAKAMNMKLATFDQKLNRARKAGLISKSYTLPREETI